jgi:hypothetical protein
MAQTIYVIFFNKNLFGARISGRVHAKSTVFSDFLEIFD